MFSNGFHISKVEFAHLQGYQFNRIPNEISILGKISKVTSSEVSFARLGTNDDSGYGAFLEQGWHFKCRRTIIAGGETVNIINKFLKCIQNVPNYLIISPGFKDLSLREGIYQDYYRRANTILSLNFSCFEFQDTSYRYCIRKNLRHSKI
jgi:hypothetical protein